MLETFLGYNSELAIPMFTIPKDMKVNIIMDFKGLNFTKD
jgi:hypothetical protein